MSQHLLSSVDQGILTLTLNRLDKRNALTLEMYSDFATALTHAEQDSAIKVVLIRGDQNCFTAGNDLNDFLSGSELNEQHPAVKLLLALHRFSKPVVAAVAGPAVGIGTTLLLHCDLVYLADNAHLQLPFVNLGLAPEFASSILLPNMLGHVRSAELLMLAEPINARRALSMGIANEVTTPDKVFSLAESKARLLTEKPPKALQATKRLMKANMSQPIERVIFNELEFYGQALAGRECQEAIRAVMEKRKPNFSSKGKA